MSNDYGDGIIVCDKISGGVSFHLFDQMSSFDKYILHNSYTNKESGEYLHSWIDSYVYEEAKEMGLLENYNINTLPELKSDNAIIVRSKFK
ncbi:MAG: hypothetical protein R3Y04_07545 [Rikenellaceae bacterium]